MKVHLSILVVEDDGKRINNFIEFLGHHELRMTDNVYDAIEFLHNQMFDVIYLDNRLGGDNGTGRDVVEFIKTLNYEPEVIFHSWDIFEFRKIQELLPQAKNKPYNSEMFYSLEHAIYE